MTTAATSISPSMMRALVLEGLSVSVPVRSRVVVVISTGLVGMGGARARGARACGAPARIGDGTPARVAGHAQHGGHAHPRATDQALLVQRAAHVDRRD